ncbi:MAG: hydantoinase B/oxoprolinase family protein, partial [Cyanobacteria bacterium J06642_3]
FKNLYQFIAEQMGIVLQNTAASVNIKERLDFSCAIFDSSGSLVANAPHIPVHLGSMGASVISLIADRATQIKPGNIYLANNPYNGGTHLPDVTLITPVFPNSPRLSEEELGKRSKPIFYVASRGHQADLGGLTPGSMPPNSSNIQEEGILFDNFLLVESGNFRESELIQLLQDHPYPARNIQQNIADFKAQIAANHQGVKELTKMVTEYSLETVQDYMQYVQDNAELAVKKALISLQDGEFSYPMDNGAKIEVKVKIDRLQATAAIDFTGTSAQLTSNFNAPLAVTQAAVLYVFRTLVKESIPLNAGCLKPLTIIIPEGCLLNPVFPAAVVAGNVETSQAVVNALYGALEVVSAAQGTMNNFTFGNKQYQYYETICGGSGAGLDLEGRGFNGTDAVQTHMTNSLLTDPEVLESRYPVRLEQFEIRKQSGGQGQYSGGNGVVRKIRFLEPMTAAILSSHRVTVPFGLQGGEPGKVGRSYIERYNQTSNNQTTEDLASCATVEMETGDLFVIETPGGGGYGKSVKY